MYDSGANISTGDSMINCCWLSDDNGHTWMGKSKWLSWQTNKSPHYRCLVMSVVLSPTHITSTNGIFSDCMINPFDLIMFANIKQCEWMAYHKISNIRRTLIGNKIVDHSDVIGASPVGAAPTTSSFSTWHLASKDSAKTAARHYKNLLSVGIWCDLY